MARKPKDEKDAKPKKEKEQPAGIEGMADLNLPSAEELEKAFKDFSLLQEDQRTALGAIGSLVKKNTNQHNIHAKAFKQFAAFKKMDVSKRTEHLIHLFHYLAHAGIVPHPDLFEDKRGKELAKTATATVKLAAKDGELMKEAEDEMAD